MVITLLLLVPAGALALALGMGRLEDALLAAAVADVVTEVSA